jgi:hypothetical protein
LLQVALTAPLDDPVQALTPIVPAFPPRSNSSTPFNLSEHCRTGTLDGSVPPAVVQKVLATRRGFHMLTPHTILKSFHQQNLSMTSQHNLFPQSEEGEETMPGILDLRHVPGKPICLVSNPSIQVTLLQQPLAPFPDHHFVMRERIHSSCSRATAIKCLPSIYCEYKNTCHVGQC